MNPTNAVPSESSHHDLKCMEIWNGNKHVENTLTASRLFAWIYSSPYHGSRRGGDVHYLSLCVGGVVARMILADVAGHGQEVAETSLKLRQAIRRFMNSKSQRRLVSQVNAHFSELEKDGRFATAIIATFQSNRFKLTLTNAGHPRPLYYSQATRSWNYLEDLFEENEEVVNLPFGIDSAMKYQNYSFQVLPGDTMLLYTDAYTEAASPSGQLLGEVGLMRIVEQASAEPEIESMGRRINQLVAEYTGGVEPEDDCTLVLLRITDEKRTPSPAEKLGGYGRWMKSFLE